MAFITLSGTLLDPNGDLAVGDQIRFTHKSTTGETVESAVSLITVSPAGTYSLPLQYGLVLVEYKDVRTQQFKNLGVATVNQDNPATSIPELLNALVPVSSAELIEFQAILADCVTAQTAAENAATTAEAFAYQLTTTDLIASTATFAAETNIPTSGFTTSGDGGNGSWKQNGVTAQTPSQSPAQLGDALLNDGNGNQWAMLLSNDFEFETFAELEASSIGNISQRLICRERDNANYIIKASSYIAITGDATLANGMIAQLQIDNYLKNSINYAQYNGGQLSDMYRGINDELTQSLNIAFVGDSITWGVGATETGVEDPRDKTLSDPRNNFASPSWCNEFKRSIIKMMGANTPYALTNHAASSLGESIITIEKLLATFPIGKKYPVAINGSATSSIVTSESSTLLNAQHRLQVSSGSTASISFLMTGDTFTLVYTQLGTASSYEVYVDGVLQGTYSSAGSPQYTVRRVHSFSRVMDGRVEIRAIHSGEAGTVSLRIEAIEINKRIRIKNQGIIGATTRTMYNWCYPDLDGPYVTYQLPDSLTGYVATPSGGSTSLSVSDAEQAYFGLQYNYGIIDTTTYDIEFSVSASDSVLVLFSSTSTGADVEFYFDNVLQGTFATSSSAPNGTFGYSNQKLIPITGGTSVLKLKAKYANYLPEPPATNRLSIEAISVFNAVDATYPTDNSFGDGVALQADDDYVVYQLGTNDRGDGDINAAQFMISNFEGMATRKPDHTKEIFMVANSVTPSRDSLDVRFMQMQDVQRSISAFAKDNSIDFIDNYTLFDKLDPASITSDGLHPNDLGHSMMANNIIFALKNSS